MKFLRYTIRFFIAVSIAMVLATLVGAYDNSTGQKAITSDKKPSIVGILQLLLGGGQKDILATNDGPYSLNEDEIFAIAGPGVLANDLNAYNGTAVLVQNAGHGTVLLHPEGSFSYTPSENYWGPDYFIYKVIKGSFSSNEATVSLEVTSINDAPIADAGIDSFVLVNETIFLNGSGSTDPENDPLTYAWSILSQPIDSDATIDTSDPKLPGLTPDKAGTYTIELIVNDGNLDSSPASLIITANPLPADPATVAPHLDPTVPTTTFAAIEFLYTGDSPLQAGVDEGTIELVRSAVIRGKVISRDGTPLPGVSISINKHPEFGQTYSRDDGMFDLAVNGGGYLTVNYFKNNYLQVQRRVNVPWRDYVWMEDVALIPLDPKVTIIDLLDATSTPIVQGSLTNDDRGPRQSTLMFQQGTSAELVMSDGSTQVINKLNVRITEHTVGPNGRAAMPAELPAGIGYTYCASLTVDEAILLGASEVRFDKPVVNYLDNFVGFEAGIEVPVYYYNFKEGQWQQSNPGRVVEIVAINNGIADLDVDGDGMAEGAESYLALGFNDNERKELASLYSLGKSLWRVQLSHFSTIDYNYPYDYPPEYYPDPPDIETAETEDDSCEQEGGSVIDCQNQVLGETVSITGTPFRLQYQSNRTAGRSTRELTVPIKAAPCAYTSIKISIAGRVFEEKVPCLMEDYNYPFSWDGMDAYGREVHGAQPVSVRIGYWYQQRLCGRRLNPITNQWDRFCILIPDQYDTLWSEPAGGTLNYWDARGQGLGGWTLDVQHAYNTETGTLFMGSGKQSSGSATGSVVFPAASGYSSRSSIKLGIDIGPEGNIYVADWYRHAVFMRKAETYTGQLIYSEAIAGQPGDTGGFAGDGGPAVEAVLYRPTDVVLAQNGVIYISDTGNNRIRKVDENGIISTVAGNGTVGSSGDGGLATDAALDTPEWLAVGPDGSLFVTTGSGYDRQNSIRHISPNGLIETVFLVPPVTIGYSTYHSQLQGLAVNQSGVLYASVRAIYTNGYPGGYCIYMIMPDGTYSIIAGTGSPLSSGDGGLAIDAGMNPTSLAVGNDGSIYVTDRSAYLGNVDNNHRIRRISPDGIITSVAGCRLNDAFCDTNGVYNQELARNSFFSTLNDIDMDAEQNIYFSSWSRIYKIDSPRPGLSFGEMRVPDISGNEIYTFSSTGKHLQTHDTLTGSVQYSFNYTDQGFLSSIEDTFGNITTIERDDEGRLSAIVGPYGHRTTFTLNGNGYLETIINPMNETFSFAYFDSGLLTSTTTPNNHRSTYTYDATGLLSTDVDAAGGSWTLNRTELQNGYEVENTTGMGRTNTYRVEQLDTGDKQLTNTSGCCGQSEVIIGTNGSVTVTLPDGTVKTTSQGSDPRFSMQAPFAESMITETPGGLTSVVTQKNTVVLSDLQDPLSLQNQTNTIAVNDRTYTKVYDATTKEMTSTSPTGRQVIVTMDEQGRVLERRTAGINPILFAYDSQGRMASITQGSNAEARHFVFAYGTDGYLSTVTDPLNRTASFEYDAAGRLVRKILPDTREVRYGYDANGNRTSIVPPGRPAHVFNYTAVDREAIYSPPDIGAGTNDTLFTYNIDRQLTQVSRPDGAAINLDYKTSGLLESLTIPRGSITHTYDPATGNIATITAPDGGVLSFINDGFLLTEITWSGQIAGSISQSYNNDFWLVSRSINSGNIINFSYDNDGMLIQAGDLSLTRNAQNGLITGMTIGKTNDLTNYSIFGEIDAYTATYDGVNIFNAQYTRDKLGRITGLSETVEGTTNTFDYIYGPAGRIIEVKEGGITTADYGYDNNGNPISRNSIIATYDAQDRLLTYGTTTFTYSDNGELQTKIVGSATTSYSYDVLGNLISVILPDATGIEYIVDGANRRIGKKVNGSLLQGFLYKDELNPIAELDGSGTVVSRFVYAGKSQVPDYMVKGGRTYRIVSNYLGSPRLVIDVNNGDIAQRINYDEFGNVLFDSNPGFQPFGFAGGVYDLDTKFTRFGARDYDAEIGRWTAKDPIRFDGGDTNLYGYVLNDPINWIDQSGKECSSAVNQAYLQALQDLLRLRRERERAQSELAANLPNAELRPGTSYPAWQFAMCIASLGTACPSVDSGGEMVQGYRERMTDYRVAQANVAYYEQRIANVDLEILSIEQSISLALQSCPCLWSTEFP